jgi:arsenite oxidase large subunit
VPNLNGGTVDKKKKWFPGETAEPAKVIFVDPRRTTVAICEQIAGKDNVLHLDIEPGTDTALFNTLLTYVVDKGWHDKDFIAKRPRGFDEAMKANRMSLEEAAASPASRSPKLGRRPNGPTSPRPRATAAHHARLREGHHLGQRQLPSSSRRWSTWCWPPTTSAGAAPACAAWAATRRATPVRPTPATGQDLHRPGGHQGQRPDVPSGACNNFQTTLNAEQHRRGLHRRAAIVKEAMGCKARGARQRADGRRDLRRLQEQGRLFVVASTCTRPSSEAAHMLLPAAHPGEMNLTSMNGERRMRLSERSWTRPGSAKPDCLIAADIANTLKAMYEKEGNAEMAKRFEGFDWKTEEDAFNDGFRRAGGPGVGPIDSQGGDTGYLATYELLRKAGNNGVQLPIKEVKDGKLSAPRCSTPTASSTPRTARPSSSRALERPARSIVADQKAKHRFWINNGRTNEVWQTAYHDQYNSFVRDRYPMALLEMNPDDAKSLGVQSGDIVELLQRLRHRPTRWPTRSRTSSEGPDLHAVRLRQRRRRRRGHLLDRPQPDALLQGHLGQAYFPCRASPSPMDPSALLGPRRSSSRPLASTASISAASRSSGSTA